MVEINKGEIDLEHVDFSAMPSLECDLECPFCMYCAGPNNPLRLNTGRFAKFLETVDWEKVTAFGFYGGEPSVDVRRYAAFADLIPKGIKKFLITNGHWTQTIGKLNEFLSLCEAHEFYVVISGTPEHKKHQAAGVIKAMGEEPGVTVKGDDEMHPMGRLAKDSWACSEKCLWHKQPIRMAVFPTGDVLLQNCDGVYPVLGKVEDGFHKLFGEAQIIRTLTCRCHVERRTVNDILKEEGLL